MLIVIAAAFAACDSAISGEVGRVEAFLTDPQAAAFSGDVNGNVQVSISADGTTWFDLGSLNGITATLQTTGVRSSVHGEQDAPVGTYSRVRLTFSGVRARLTAGSTIGTMVLSNDTDVTLGGDDGSLVVILETSSFAVTASDANRRAILVTLNAASWLTEAAVQSLVVEDPAIETAVTVATMQEPRT